MHIQVPENHGVTVAGSPDMAYDVALDIWIINFSQLRSTYQLSSSKYHHTPELNMVGN